MRFIKFKAIELRSSNGNPKKYENEIFFAVPITSIIEYAEDPTGKLPDTITCQDGDMISQYALVTGQRSYIYDQLHYEVTQCQMK